MHPWDPHKAMKDIDVGDFYFKRKNYKAALDRFQEALLYKPNDALATFKVGQCEENLNHPEAARTAYEGYLKILPSGPMAEEAKKGLERLKNSTAKKSE
jgi:regulator of sirC expression with transglutaminase-like and TPR domain